MIEKELNQAISLLPSNYEFEIPKTIAQLKKYKVEKVALQFPEGLLIYSHVISDILEHFAQVSTVILGDVTYGACCVDDYASKALGCDFLIHYGHSCLVPIQHTRLRTIYIFVSISININSLLTSISNNIEKNSKIAAISTVQYLNTLIKLPTLLKDDYKIYLPREKPLSHGEVLGCTSPKLDKDTDYILYIGDGRFHLESAMIYNPTIKAYQYNPYNGIMSIEEYDYSKMYYSRKNAIKKSQPVKNIGIIQSILGRQGNPVIVENLKEKLIKQGKNPFVFLMSEISMEKLFEFKEIEAWVQVGCPRLSIDWGDEFNIPILNPYEAMVAWGGVKYKNQYPMDYYSSEKQIWNN